MSELFLTALNMSLTASYVIIFVIIIRLLLKKAPKVISYALWGVVAFRLLIPFSFESMFSLMPRNANTVPIPHDIIYQQNPQINSGIEAVDSFVNSSLPAPTFEASINPLQIYVEIVAYIWIIGIVILLVYSLVSILALKRQLKSAQLIEKNIFEATNLKTPFVLGFTKPKIYLPVGLDAAERSYILLHEHTHIYRKDHIIKVLAFFTLSIHWFNPLVWIAFMLMSKDMELSCDERVLKETDEEIKKPYANSLLSLATGRQILNGSPLAFGEGNVRGRIKNVLNYKKPRFWVIVLSIVIVTVAGIGLIANSKDATIEPTAPDLSFEQTVGVDMVELDYASDSIVIFHDYFGLFVYDLNSLQIIRSLDLKPLNCHQTQGDNYCDVSVSMDGNTVQLHPMSSKNMFVYTISDNTLQEIAHKAMDNPFGSQFASIVEVINSTVLGNYSHHAVLFDTGEYGYLHTEDGTIGTLSYVRGDKVFRLFDIKASLSDRRPMIMVNGKLYFDTGKQVVEIDDSTIIGEISASVDQSEKPTEDGQTNFGSIGAKYAYYEGNIVILINNKWMLFEREYNALNRETQSNPASEQSAENVLNQLANKDFSIKGKNLYSADDDTIVEFGKAFVNLFNGAVAEQKKVSFEKYISNNNLQEFTGKMLELTQKQDLLGRNVIIYGLNNEFNQAKVQHMEDNLCYLELQFEFQGSGMGCKMLITTENKSLKLVDLYFGSKDGVDTFTTGHPAEREINDSNLWENEEWVKGVFDKLEDFEEMLSS